MEAQTQKQLTHYESSICTVPGRPGQKGSSHGLSEMVENGREIKVLWFLYNLRFFVPRIPCFHFAYPSLQTSLHFKVNVM